MIILASKSPRRRELLDLAGIKYECIPSDAEELVPEGMAAADMPQYLSGIKARDIAKDHPNDTIIGADTLVLLDGAALGKPGDRSDAARMLRKLSGRVHEVYTGVTIIKPGIEPQAFTSCTEVEFYELSDKEIEDYIETGEPMDKAGAYGIQGFGSTLVKRINGDYFTIMGLPIAQVARLIRGL